LRYFAFEPDKREAERLRQQSQHSGFEVIDWGLAKENGERDLHITKHRGCCSLLEVDPESEWFKRYRPGEGEVESIVRIKTCSVDGFAKTKGLQIDFLKVDTEGTELEVLEGSEEQLLSNVLGVRTGVNFQQVYKNQPLFPEVHNYLAAKHFFLLNLDYFGRGVPRYGLFRNPDPLSLDNERYGVLVGTDGVWLKEYDWVCEQCNQNTGALAYATLKYAYFCLLNHAADVGLDTLMTFVTELKGTFSTEVASSQLFLALRRTYATFLGRWRAYPDTQWELARSTFKTLFSLELEGGNKYWEFIQSL
jgi:FkbM family methyltransferase